MRVINTTEWTYEQIAPHGKAITAHMRKLAEKFPQDVTVESLAHECMTGARQLWLHLDDDDHCAAISLTHIRTVDSTGTKIVTLTSHAGEAGLDQVPEMCATIEAWAKEQGADYTAAEGRGGWDKALKREGYQRYAVIWRKKVA